MSKEPPPEIPIAALHNAFKVEPRDAVLYILLPQRADREIDSDKVAVAEGLVFLFEACDLGEEEGEDTNI